MNNWSNETMRAVNFRRLIRFIQTNLKEFLFEPVDSTTETSIINIVTKILTRAYKDNFIIETELNYEKRDIITRIFTPDGEVEFTMTTQEE